jgi:hypothetical protein
MGPGDEHATPIRIWCRIVEKLTFGIAFCVHCSMNNALRILVTLVLCAVPFAAVLVAQPLGGPPPCWPPPCIPIDGGLGILVAAGAILGGKQALRMRRGRSGKL